MKRRHFIAFLGGAASSHLLSTSLRAQSVTPTVGFLGAASPEGYAPFVGGFRQGLKEAGFDDGRNVAILYRWAEGQYDRLPALAAELVSRQVAVIVATGGLAASLAAKDATHTIPVVFTLGSDPIKFGPVASLNRPGANITGVTLFTTLLGAKRLELIHELVPKTSVIALLVNPTQQLDAQFADVEGAARTLGMQLVTLTASTDREIDEAFATLVPRDAGPKTSRRVTGKRRPLFSQQAGSACCGCGAPRYPDDV
jgi:putative tryptophan/tyrosine transport system substrate-binding protein